MRREEERVFLETPKITSHLCLLPCPVSTHIRHRHRRRWIEAFLSVFVPLRRCRMEEYFPLLFPIRPILLICFVPSYRTFALVPKLTSTMPTCVLLCREQTVPSISEHHLACCGVVLCTAYAYAPQCTRKLRSWPDFSTRIPWDSGKHGLHACTQNSATGKLLLYYPLPKRSSRSSLCVNIWRLRPAASAGKCPKEVSRPGGSKSEAPNSIFLRAFFC